MQTSSRPKPPFPKCHQEPPCTSSHPTHCEACSPILPPATSPTCQPHLCLKHPHPSESLAEHPFFCTPSTHTPMLCTQSGSPRFCDCKASWLRWFFPNPPCQLWKLHGSLAPRQEAETAAAQCHLQVQ
ncbi:hypothetical protein AAHE18_15G068700 [Arachis hypogaea]